MDFLEVYAFVELALTALPSIICLIVTLSYRNKCKRQDDILRNQMNYLITKMAEVSDKNDALRNDVGKYLEDIRRDLVLQNDTFTRSVNARGAAITRDMASILGEHKLSHDELEKALESLTGGMGMMQNELYEFRNDIHEVQANIHKDCKSAGLIAVPMEDDYD